MSLRELKYRPSTNRRGKTGEDKVKRILQDKLSEKDYHIINNIAVKDQLGRITQVDHIIVSIYGVFVIETKNVKGKLYGDVNDPNWDIVMGYKCYQLPNPILQNQHHVNVIKHILDIPDTQIYNYVCFMERAILKMRNVEGKVIPISNLSRAVKKKTKVIFTRDQVEEIVTKLYRARASKQEAKVYANMLIRKPRQNSN